MAVAYSCRLILTCIISSMQYNYIVGNCIYLFILVQCIEIISKQVKDNTVTVQFRGNALFTCQVGNGQVLPCASPHTFTNLVEGKNTITISSTTKSLQFLCSKRFDVTIGGISGYDN